MSNFISKGIDWLNSKVDTNCVEPVLWIKENETRQITATVIEPETTTNREGIRVKSDTFTFLITRSQLLGITPKRGQKLRRLNYNEDYQVVITEGNVTDYNDPNRKKIAVSAKLCS